jgi:hypothetical protein
MILKKMWVTTDEDVALKTLLEQSFDDENSGQIADTIITIYNRGDLK